MAKNARKLPKQLSYDPSDFNTTEIRFNKRRCGRFKISQLFLALEYGRRIIVRFFGLFYNIGARCGETCNFNTFTTMPRG